jgi:ribonucleotide monophosphatase NagD (HAD superfamily)
LDLPNGRFHMLDSRIMLALPLRPQTTWRSFGISRRALQTAATALPIPPFAFAFDIDGVLLRSSDPLPRATKALSYLQSQRIPYILLTNGGGKHESERVADLSKKLEVDMDTSMFVQSHTPFADMDQYKDKTVMVVGGEGDKCRVVAEAYGQACM